MEGVQPRRVITQPVEDREALAGWQLSTPYGQPRATQVQGVTFTVPVTENEETDVISIRKAVHNELPSPEQEARLQRNVSYMSSRSISSDDEGSMVVDMRHQHQLHDNVKIRQPGVSNQDLSINVRKVEQPRRCHAVDDLVLDDLDEVDEIEDPSQKGYVTLGNEDDISNLLAEKTKEKGVICNNKVLHCENGMYEEGRQYKIIKGTQSKGAYGEAAMCEDLKTGKTFMLKKVRSKLSKNEVAVPLMFRGNVGIPEVFGVVYKNQETEIFQEFAGLSIKKLRDSHYAEKLQDPKMVMLLAFQAFATLDKLHSRGVTHQDIKPENLCIDTHEKNWRLKMIDFGSSQTPNDQVTEGLTNEYLSPESCAAILQVATGKIPKEAGRLGPGTDVWALSLSLLYCLCGYHVMVYVCTGDTAYRDTDPQKLMEKRIQCLFRIASLKDEEITSKLIHSSWPDSLKMLLLHTLRVNPKDRWTAKQAAEFILIVLRGGALPVDQRLAAAPEPSGFTLSPSRLMVRTQAAAAPQQYTIQAVQETKAEQCSSPGSPASSTTSTNSSVSAYLPAFDDLLPDDLSKKAPRPYKRKSYREEPYAQPAGRGSKVIKM
ncbi:MAP kinase-interacting serine/threonine-protein kinase 1-like isoform X2 [Littorina saxatilis]|uniref:Protein kinase domain-containing protein n=2 Tax=Littorina saxatilis TaxID=31220 RepID=A0AAN9BQA0_9CAEN